MNFNQLDTQLIIATSAKEVMTEVSQQLLLPAGIGINDLNSIFAQMLKPGIDFGEIFFQQKWHEHWLLEEGQVKSSVFEFDNGAGIRALSGEATGFSYANQFNLALLQQTANLAANIAHAGKTLSLANWHQSTARRRYPADSPQGDIGSAAKIALLQKADQLAHQLDSAICHVEISLSISYEQILVCASDATLAADIRPMVQGSVSVIAQRNKKRERGYSGGGGRISLAQFISQGGFTDYVKEAVKQALINLEAEEAPAGQFPVILGPGWPGVLLHEAVGHGLESDFNRKKSSVYSNQLGTMIASPLINVVDDATLAWRRGSLTIDDEGTPGQATTLIEKGRLVGYLQDKLNARLMNMPLTGNGRRQSYAYLPIPRMTNTYLLPGDYAQQEMIESIKQGIFAVNFSGGQVDITSGQFVFVANEAYWIENGRIKYPVRGATLIGNGQQVMANVNMVGNDWQLDPGIGVCGKQGQSVAVGVGQPSVKLSEITVGGTQV